SASHPDIPSPRASQCFAPPSQLLESPRQLSPPPSSPTRALRHIPRANVSTASPRATHSSPSSSQTTRLSLPRARRATPSPPSPLSQSSTDVDPHQTARNPAYPNFPPAIKTDET